MAAYAHAITFFVCNYSLGALDQEPIKAISAYLGNLPRIKYLGFGTFLSSFFAPKEGVVILLVNILVYFATVYNSLGLFNSNGEFLLKRDHYLNSCIGLSLLLAFISTLSTIESIMKEKVI